MLQRQFAGTVTPRVGIVAEPGAVGAAGTALIQNLTDRAGLTVAVQAALAPTPAGRTALAATVAGAGCDVVLALAGTGSGAAGLTQLMRELSGVPVLGIGAPFESLRPADVAPPAGGAVPVILRTASWSADLARRSPVAAAVAALYQRLFGLPMNAAAANAFTAALTLAQAIDGAGSDRAVEIRASLRRIWVPATATIMPWTGIRFDADGQNPLAAAVVEGLDAKGFRVVHPPELAQGPPIWSDAGRA
jgi:branched-chain amino acid transport system substrate-binding protein